MKPNFKLSAISPAVAENDREQVSLEYDPAISTYAVVLLWEDVHKNPEKVRHNIFGAYLCSMGLLAETKQDLLFLRDLAADIDLQQKLAVIRATAAEKGAAI
jgi:hypothetical protein